MAGGPSAERDRAADERRRQQRQLVLVRRPRQILTVE